MRDPALGSADDDRMNGRHGDRHAERAQVRVSCDQAQRNGQSAKRSRAVEGWFHGTAPRMDLPRASRAAVSIGVQGC